MIKRKLMEQHLEEACPMKMLIPKDGGAGYNCFLPC